MSTSVKIGWLKDKEGNKFAPKTLASQVQTSDGTLLEDKIELDIDKIKVAYFTYGESTYSEVKKAYDDRKMIIVKVDHGVYKCLAYLNVNATSPGVLDYFYFTYSTDTKLYNIKLDDDSNWSEEEVIPSSVSYFTFSESTYDEIKSAYDAGKTIYMKYGNILSVLASYDDTNNKFNFCVVSGSLIHYYISINSNNGWEWKYAELAKKSDIPIITYGTEDLEAGVSELETGALYFVYE